ncbi:META domain-containing protein [Pontibacter sp. H259]|uniref:META domain-containing protein n=1 Tax=Pontibacter sp. H259 TaxID=3133421 RepID=UPI0030BA85A8
MKSLYLGLLFLLLISCKTATPAQPTAEGDSILDAYWMLMSLEGESPQTPNNTRTAYIRFQENENDVKGFSGCNTFFGKYELSGNSLRLSNLGSTRMMCPIMEQETRMMRVLERVDSYKLSDRILTFYQGNEAIATFRTGNPDEVEPQSPSRKVRIKRL